MNPRDASNPSVGILSMNYCTWAFYMGSGDQDSGCSTCMASTKAISPTLMGPFLSCTVQFMLSFYTKINLIVCQQLSSQVEGELHWCSSDLSAISNLMVSHVFWSELVGDALETSVISHLGDQYEVLLICSFVSCSRSGTKQVNVCHSKHIYT